MKSDYSVLMSVYGKENPIFLKESIQSILSQTVSTNDFVLVCDGPLTPELDAVINSFSGINVVRLPENKGLGQALSHGITLCKNELVARMDSDDIAFPDRMEKQLDAFSANPDVSLISGTIVEFQDNISNIKGKRELPISNEEIRAFSRKRNPFNHPAVMFKKSAVIQCGNYDESYHLFEDYYLWVRMLQKGFKGFNLKDNLVYMRVDDNTIIRRGGASYAREMLRFHKWLRKQGWSTWGDYLTGAVPHAMVCVLPKGIRKAVYKRLH